MTEQPPNNQEQTPEKLQIDDLNNFQFHAAYMVYSDLFDAANGAEAKKDLNLNIEELKNSKISPESFYQNVSRYRRDVVTTQRKRDWRMKSQKQERIRRHKK
jgi:hypothetical protein